MMPGDKKQCCSCKKMVSVANFARHQRTCKGEVRGDGKSCCTFCNKAFRNDYLKVHERKCKKRADYTTKQAYEARIEALQSEVNALQRAVRYLKDEKMELLSENNALTEQVADLRVAVATRNTTYNYYSVYIDRMTPWCFNPDDPDHLAFVDAEVAELEARMARDERITPLVPGSRDCGMQVALRTRIIYDRALELIQNKSPNYLVSNLSRRLGFYVNKGSPVFDNQMWQLKAFYGEVIKRLENNSLKDWHWEVRKELARYVREPAASRAKILRLQEA